METLCSKIIYQVETKSGAENTRAQYTKLQRTLLTNQQLSNQI